MATSNTEHASEMHASGNLNHLYTIQEGNTFNCTEVLQEYLATESLEEFDGFNDTHSELVNEQINDEQTIMNLKSQIKILQDKIKKSEDITQMYEKQLIEQENNIFNLKHRINEEIEEKSNLKAYYSDETSKLNNEINELEQKNKENMDRSRQLIEAKMQDIKILQEQKLSLLQSLTNEITKLNNIITKLKDDIKIEQQLKQNVKDWYEYKLMKLNEKVLNRNNELVELQDGIFGKGETIENLQIELRKERERSKKLHDDLLCVEREKKQVENILRMQTEEMLSMQRKYEQKIEPLSNDTENTAHIFQKDGFDSKRLSIAETRKRLPLQDASNFNDSYISQSREKLNM